MPDITTPRPAPAGSSYAAGRSSRRARSPQRTPFGNATPQSEHRKSLIPGSSVKHLSGRMAKMKDPRPVFDKSWMLSAVKQITTFLTSTGYPHSLSPKFIQGPSGKEFYGLMQFLFAQIDPNTPLTKKMDEELPEALQRIRYPLNVTKASLLLVGAPTTWPSVLASLHWVVELLSIDMKLIQPYLRGEEPLMPVSARGAPSSGARSKSWQDLEWRRRFDILARTYKAFLHGQDEVVQELHGEKRAQAEAIRKARETTLIDLAKERTALETRLTEAEKRPRLPEVKDRVSRLRNDLTRKKTNLSAEKRKLAELQDALRQLQAKADVRDREQQKLETEKERLDKILRDQPITVAEQKELLKERSQLQDATKTLAKKELELTECEKSNEEKREATYKVRDEARNKCRQHMADGQKFEAAMAQKQQELQDAQALLQELQKQRESYLEKIAVLREKQEHSETNKVKLTGQVSEKEKIYNRLKADSEQEAKTGAAELQAKRAHLEKVVKQTEDLRKQRENIADLIQQRRREHRSLEREFQQEKQEEERKLRRKCQDFRDRKTRDVRRLTQLESKLFAERERIDLLQQRDFNLRYIKPGRKSREARKSLDRIATASEVLRAPEAEVEAHLRQTVPVVTAADRASRSGRPPTAPTVILTGTSAATSSSSRFTGTGGGAPSGSGLNVSMRREQPAVVADERCQASFVSTTSQHPAEIMMQQDENHKTASRNPIPLSVQMKQEAPEDDLRNRIGSRMDFEDDDLEPAPPGSTPARGRRKGSDLGGAGAAAQSKIDTSGLNIMNVNDRLLNPEESPVPQSRSDMRAIRENLSEMQQRLTGAVGAAGNSSASSSAKPPAAITGRIPYGNDEDNFEQVLEEHSKRAAVGASLFSKPDVEVAPPQIAHQQRPGSFSASVFGGTSAHHPPIGAQSAGSSAAGSTFSSNIFRPSGRSGQPATSSVTHNVGSTTYGGSSSSTASNIFGAGGPAPGKSLFTGIPLDPAARTAIFGASAAGGSSGVLSQTNPAIGDPGHSLPGAIPMTGQHPHQPPGMKKVSPERGSWLLDTDESHIMNNSHDAHLGTGPGLSVPPTPFDHDVPIAADYQAPAGPTPTKPSSEALLSAEQMQNRIVVSEDLVKLVKKPQTPPAKHDEMHSNLNQSVLRTPQNNNNHGSSSFVSAAGQRIGAASASRLHDHSFSSAQEDPSREFHEFYQNSRVFASTSARKQFVDGTYSGSTPLNNRTPVANSRSMDLLPSMQLQVDSHLRPHSSSLDHQILQPCFENIPADDNKNAFHFQALQPGGAGAGKETEKTKEPMAEQRESAPLSGQNVNNLQNFLRNSALPPLDPDAKSSFGDTSSQCSTSFMGGRTGVFFNVKGRRYSDERKKKRPTNENAPPSGNRA
ncbi:unnamed protein product [Amoebophrya sp. A120]|nr:unnamed protein product [Amoebophrya sp. A120]|eukprot:GSA120T00001538001.1